ncbi:hypothetical protein BO70DRAFT_357935 [Aspergillus heteromorphus CBS 117.55]|uniref:Uncharacterized protein n=1 Tax=Aspergillus heteromorphus CBS 117.55 TaxID=1448321 RepID=A0A317X2K9_9EURO|nr:uncharacterized protein BO70DRAFT_357935 [Aspergillus heteromorphus CBS 117.55]PWY92793.1 hypothetical protein BO70DRAFT_357935 [Aspergillus heteromorphus CBS 117.55]
MSVSSSTIYLPYRLTATATANATYYLHQIQIHRVIQNHLRGTNSPVRPSLSSWAAPAASQPGSDGIPGDSHRCPARSHFALGLPCTLEPGGASSSSSSSSRTRNAACNHVSQAPNPQPQPSELGPGGGRNSRKESAIEFWGNPLGLWSSIRGLTLSRSVCRSVGRSAEDVRRTSR